MLIKTKVLRAVVAHARRVVDAKSPTPLLRGVRLAANGGVLRVDATDTSLWLSLAVAVEGDLSPIVVDLTQLALVVDANQKSAVENIAISVEKGAIPVVVVEAGARRFSLGGMFSSDFPSPRKVEGKHTTVSYTDVAQLREALAFVSPAMSQDTTRVHLRGLWLVDNMVFATDGHRLHVEKGLPVAKGETFVPASAVPVLQGLLAVATGEVVVHKHAYKNTAQSSAARAVWTLPIADGTAELHTTWAGVKAPPISHVIPSADHATVAVHLKRNDAENVFKLAAKVNAHGPTRLSVDAAMCITSVLDDGGEITEEVPTNKLVGTVEAGVCAEYILDALKGMGGDVVMTNGGHELDPWRIETMGNENRVAVVMPMRLR